MTALALEAPFAVFQTDQEGEKPDSSQPASTATG